MVTQATEPAPQTLPPNDRDFEAYRLVKVEKKSTRDAAKLLRISQTRVCQVIARVADYLVDVTQPDDEFRREKQLAVARQVAAAELDYCKQLAMRSFESSIGMKRIEHEATDARGNVVRRATTREYFGETRYLATIGRLAVIGSKLPPCALPIIGCLADEDQTVGEELEADADEVAVTESVQPVAEAGPQVKTPLKEECSVQLGEQSPRTSQPPIGEAAKFESIRLYNQAVRMMNMPEEQISEPVQLAKPPAHTSQPEHRQPTAADRKRLRREQRKLLKTKKAL